jgi:DNA-binding NarL/FixJ family response regulator
MAIRTLIVDDHRNIRALIRLLIEEVDEGLAVGGEASTAMEALDQIDDVDPTVVLLDYKMPEVDGLEAAERILARRPNQAIVLCSAFVDDQLRERARRAGIVACLSKADFNSLPEVLREVAQAA